MPEVKGRDFARALRLGGRGVVRLNVYESTSFVSFSIVTYNYPFQYRKAEFFGYLHG